jgi:hypothetical protein
VPRSAEQRPVRFTSRRAATGTESPLPRVLLNSGPATGRGAAQVPVTHGTARPAACVQTKTKPSSVSAMPRPSHIPIPTDRANELPFRAATAHGSIGSRRCMIPSPAWSRNRAVTFFSWKYVFQSTG